MSGRDRSLVGIVVARLAAAVEEALSGGEANRTRRTSRQAHARYAFRLALNPVAWVNRQVETIHFIDRDTVRRRVSIDFELSEDDHLQPGEEIAVPVMLLRKEHLRNFDIRDDEDRALAVMTAEQNGELAAAGLNAYLSGLRKGSKLSEQENEAIDSIVKEPDRAKGAAAAGAALEPGGALDSAVALEPAATQQNLIGLIRQLGDAFMLLVTVPYTPGHRQVVKVAYDVAHRTGRERGAASRLYHRIVRFVSSFGMIARLEVFDGLLVGLAASYHVEVVPPADTYAAETSLEIPGDKLVIDQRLHRFRPHLYVFGRGRRERATLTVLIHAVREGLIPPLLLAGALISATLWFVDKEATKGRLDGQTLAALLLVPFALAAYYVRSGENSYLTSMLRGVRMVAAIPVLAGVLVIASLGLGYLKIDPHTHEKVSDWAFDASRYAAYVSSGATALLALAFAAPLFGRASRPTIRFLQHVTSGWSRTRRALLGGIPAAVLLAWGVGRLLGFCGL